MTCNGTWISTDAVADRAMDEALRAEVGERAACEIRYENKPWPNDAIQRAGEVTWRARKAIASGTCEVCGGGPERCAFAKGCSCWRGTPCSKRRAS